MEQNEETYETPNMDALLESTEQLTYPQYLYRVTKAAEADIKLNPGMDASEGRIERMNRLTVDTFTNIFTMVSMGTSNVNPIFKFVEIPGDEILVDWSLHTIEEWANMEQNSETAVRLAAAVVKVIGH